MLCPHPHESIIVATPLEMATNFVFVPAESIQQQHPCICVIMKFDLKRNTFTCIYIKYIVVMQLHAQLDTQSNASSASVYLRVLHAITSYNIPHTQWRSQDTEFTRAQSNCTLPKAVDRGVQGRSVHAKRGRKIFSYQDGLSQHIRALHCKSSLLSSNTSPRIDVAERR